MAGAHFKKRGRDDAPKSKTTRPSKKLKKQPTYHSSSSEDGGSDAEDADTFQAVNLLDSDEDDIHNAKVDDGAASESVDAASTSGSDAPPQPKKKAAPKSIAKNAPKSKLVKDAPSESEEEEDRQDSDAGDDDQDENDEYSDLDDEAGSGDDEDGVQSGDKIRHKTSKSKRSDPDAFANSLSKILSTKLSSTRRADPVLARSAEAQEASRKAVDTALEQKARKKLRDQKRLALEKGRVRDVLVATNSTFSNINPVTGEVLKGELRGETTAEILETERRLRKVAQRGVVQLFNAFRTAQVKAAEAERITKKEGVIGIDRKKEKVTEMSKKGFLDLIASGGGGLKKGPLEEA